MTSPCQTLAHRRAAGLLALAVAAAAFPAAADGVKLRAAGSVYEDSKGAGLREPEGVALTGTSLVVADTGNGRLVRFVVGPDKIESASETVYAELPYPVRVVADSKGALYVLDGKLRRIGRVAATGEFSGYVELDPAAVPRAIAVDRKDNLWVIDVARGKALMIDAEGKPVRELALPAEPGVFFSDVAADAKGNVFALDSVGRRVFVARPGAPAFEPHGPALRQELDFATSIAVDDAGRLFVADQNGSGIVVLGPDGSFRGRQSGDGWKEGQLRYPSALACRGDRLLVADRANNRVQVFTVVQ